MKNGVKNIKYYLIFCILLVIFSISNVRAQIIESSYQDMTTQPLAQIGDNYFIEFDGHTIDISYTDNAQVTMVIDDHTYTISTRPINYMWFVLTYNPTTHVISFEYDGYFPYQVEMYPSLGTKKMYFSNSCNVSSGCYVDFHNGEYITKGNSQFITNETYNGLLYYRVDLDDYSSINGSASSWTYYNEYILFSNMSFSYEQTFPAPSVDQREVYSFVSTTPVIIPIQIDTNELSIIPNNDNTKTWVYGYEVILSLNDEYTGYTNYCNYIDETGTTKRVDLSGDSNTSIFKTNIAQDIACYTYEGETLIQETTKTINAPTLQQHVNINSNTFTNYISSVDIDYNYYTTSTNIPKYIPFRLIFEQQEYTSNPITSFLGYYVDANGNLHETSNITLVNVQQRYTDAQNVITGYIDTGGFSNFKVSFKIDRRMAMLEYNLKYLDTTPTTWTNSEFNVTFLNEDFTGYNYYYFEDANVIAYIYKINDNNADTGRIIFKNNLDIVGQWFDNNNFTYLEEKTRYNSNYDNYNITFDYNTGKKIFILRLNTALLNNVYGFYVPIGWGVKFTSAYIEENVPINNDNGTLGNVTPGSNNNLILSNENRSIFEIVGTAITEQTGLFSWFKEMFEYGFNKLPNSVKAIIIVPFCITIIVVLLFHVMRW